jgi:ribonuclease J
LAFASAGFSATKEEGGRYKPVFERELHVSGHASREDLAEVIDQIDPDRIIPIHTEAREWFADRFEDVVLAEEGVGIEF